MSGNDNDRVEYQRLIDESKSVSEEPVHKAEEAAVFAATFITPTRGPSMSRRPSRPVQKAAETGKDGERIVMITIDASENSERAFEYALKNVLRSDGKDVAHLVHHYAVAGPSEFAPYALEAMNMEKKHRRTKGTDLLKKYAKVLHKNKIKVQANLLCGGDLRDAVLEYATKTKPEMLVVGCRGHGSLKRALLGSLSSHLVHHSKVPVLVVR